MYHYQSDFTQFMNDYLQKNPQEAKQRLENRAILWDVQLSPKEQKEFQAASVQRGSYAYQSQ